MRKRLLRSRSGEGYPMVIAVTLCLLMLFMVISGFIPKRADKWIAGWKKATAKTETNSWKRLYAFIWAISARRILPSISRTHWWQRCAGSSRTAPTAPTAFSSSVRWSRASWRTPSPPTSGIRWRIAAPCAGMWWTR